MIIADQGKTSRVLTNLVDNALKFTPTGEQVSITAELSPDGDMMIVKVIDRGPGVPEAYRDKIFDRFTQIPKQLGRKRGTGLGLTFCRLAVEAHGGRIWVEPRPEGGSIFIFSMPVDFTKL
jgi:signal transduction histidine kinase